MNDTLTGAGANAAVNAAIAEADRLEVAVTIAVVDKGGHLIALSRSENANLVSLDLAIGKAYTAVVMNESTRRISELVQPGQELYHLDLAVSGRPLVVFAGGLPIGSPVQGGIGVSGGSPDQDETIADAGLRSLTSMWSDHQGLL